MFAPDFGAGEFGGSPEARPIGEIKVAVFNSVSFLQRLRKFEIELGRNLTQEDVTKYCAKSVFILESSPDFFDPETKPGNLNFNEKGIYLGIWKDTPPERIKEIRTFIFEALTQAKLEGRLLWEDGEVRRIHTVDEVRELFERNGMDLTEINSMTGNFSATGFKGHYSKREFPSLDLVT